MECYNDKNYYETLEVCLYECTSSLLIGFTFTLYILFGSDIKVSIAISVMNLLRIFSNNVSDFTSELPMIFKWKSQIDVVQEFLLEKELKVLRNNYEEAKICLKDCNFSNKNEKILLSNINLNINKKFNIIVGEVGSGKT
jgi:ABC-type multidrug transport system fused ATPase/permease subunit